MQRLIVHALLATDHGILILKRTATERGRRNVYPEFWDLPGGLAQPTELPRNAAIRECFEETGLHITVDDIIGEDSTYDTEKKRCLPD